MDEKNYNLILKLNQIVKTILKTHYQYDYLFIDLEITDYMINYLFELDYFQGSTDKDIEYYYYCIFLVVNNYRCDIYLSYSEYSLLFTDLNIPNLKENITWTQFDILCIFDYKIPIKDIYDSFGNVILCDTLKRTLPHIVGYNRDIYPMVIGQNNLPFWLSLE